MILYLLINKNTYDVEFASFDENAAKEKATDNLILKELKLSSTLQEQVYSFVGREWSKEDVIAQLTCYFDVDENGVKYKVGAKFGINCADEDALDKCLDNTVEKIIDVFDSHWDANLDENSMYQNAIERVLNDE